MASQATVEAVDSLIIVEDLKMAPNSRSRQCVRFIGIPPILMSLLVMAAGAAGQLTMMMTSSEAEAVPPREVRAMVETLNLDALEQELVQTAFDGYRAAFAEASTTHAEEQQRLRKEMREGNWESATRRMNEKRAQWSATRTRLKEQFFRDVQDLLEPGEEPLWLRFMRDHRRRMTLAQRAALGGEGVDIIDLVEEIDLDAQYRDQIEPTLDLYAVQLDEALIARNACIDEMMTEFDLDTENPAEIAEAVQKRAETMRRRRIAVRDLNEQFLEVIASRLALDAADDLRERFLRRSYPGIYRRTAADRYLEEIQRLESLTESQQATISMIERDYRAQIDDVNRRLVDLRREAEKEAAAPPPVVLEGVPAGDGSAPGETAHIATVSIGIAIDGDSDSPILIPSGAEPDDRERELRDRKREVINETIERLFAALTAEQQLEAPKPEKEVDLAERIREQLERALSGGEAQIIEFEDGETGVGITIQLDEGSGPADDGG